MKGIFLDAGGATCERYDEYIYAGGVAYEHIFRDNHSFTLKFGAGLITVYDKEFRQATYYQQGKGDRRYDENFLIFWKLGWNFFWI